MIAQRSATGRSRIPSLDGTIERTSSMFRKIAVALIATSVLAAPALAKTKTMPATQASTANAAAKPEGKPVATLKVKRHRHYAGHHQHHRHHIYAGKDRHHMYA